MSFPLEPDGSLSRDVAPPQFGVDGEQAERDWPLMTHDEVAAVLARIDGAGEPARLTWHSPRQFAAAVLVQMTDGRGLFVKRHHVSLRDVEGLEEEHRFIAHLRERGMPVVEILADRDGATAFASGDWTYEVHVRAPGVDPYRGVMSWQPFTHASHAYAAGRALANCIARRPATMRRRGPCGPCCRAFACCRPPIWRARSNAGSTRSRCSCARLVRATGAATWPTRSARITHASFRCCPRLRRCGRTATGMRRTCCGPRRDLARRCGPCWISGCRIAPVR